MNEYLINYSIENNGFLWIFPTSHNIIIQADSAQAAYNGLQRGAMLAGARVNMKSISRL